MQVMMELQIMLQQLQTIDQTQLPTQEAVQNMSQDFYMKLFYQKRQH